MGRRELQRKVVSNILLIGISMVMVIGFFYHGTFYQIGLVPLVIIGGVTVFAVLKVISWANSRLDVERKGRVGNLLFKADRIPSVLYGGMDTTIRPLKKGRLRSDMICNVRATLRGRPAGHVLITDIRRKRLCDLTDKETKDEGMTASAFREDFIRRYGGSDGQIIRIINFRAV